MGIPRPDTDRLSDRAVIRVAVALYVLPVVVALAVRGWGAALPFLKGDSFYYLTVGRNVARYGSFSFDGSHPTNGFHPLWQLLVALVCALGRLVSADETTLLAVLLLLGTALMGAAIAVLGSCLRLALGRVPLAFLLLPIGAYGLLVSPLLLVPEFFSHTASNVPYTRANFLLDATLWSYANGMESAVAILAYAALLYVSVRTPLFAGARSGVLVGSSLALLLLARLDAGLFMTTAWIAPSFVYHALRRDGRRLASVTIAGVIPVAVTLGYLAVNQAYAGMAFPISGSIKSTFPHVADGLAVLRDLARPNEIGQRNVLIHRVVRLAQVVVPVVVGALAVPWSLARRRTGGAWSAALGLSGLFAVLLGLHNLLFVRFGHHGTWMVPVSVVFVSLFALTLVAPLDRRWLPRRPATACALALVTASVAACSYDEARSRSLASYLTEVVPELVRHYRGREPRIVDMDDGVSAYATGYPALAGRGLALDVEAARERRQGRFLRLAHARGHDRIVSFFYFGNAGRRLHAGSPPEQVGQAAVRLLGSQVGPEDYAAFRFRVDYVSEPALPIYPYRLVVLAFEPR